MKVSNSFLRKVAALLKVASLRSFGFALKWRIDAALALP